jgi:hypothetical protein
MHVHRLVNDNKWWWASVAAAGLYFQSTMRRMLLESDPGPDPLRAHPPFLAFVESLES